MFRNDNNLLDLLADVAEEQISESDDDFDSNESNDISTINEACLEDDTQDDNQSDADNIQDEEDNIPTIKILMDCMVQLGYKVEQEGICNGFAYAAALSFLTAHTLDKFYERLDTVNILHKNLVESLNENPRQLKEKLKDRLPSNELASLQENLLDISAFFDTIEIGQNAIQLNQIFPTFDGNYAKLAQVNATKEIEERGGLVADKKWELSAAFDQEEFVRYLCELDLIAKQQSKHFVVTLATSRHISLLCYDPNSGWSFVESNEEDAIKKTNAEELSEIIWNCRNYYRAESSTTTHNDIVETASASDDETASTSDHVPDTDSEHECDSGEEDYGVTDKKYLILTSAFVTTFDNKAEIEFMIAALQSSAVWQDISRITLDKAFHFTDFGDIGWFSACSGSSELLNAAIEVVKKDTAVSLNRRERFIKDFLNNHNHIGLKPIHCAAIHGHVEVAKLLCENSSKLTTEDSKDHYTPAHLAAAHGHINILKLLASYGVNLDQPNSKGQTPVDVAKEKNRPHVVAFLEQRKLDLNNSQPNNFSNDRVGLFAPKRSHDKASATDVGLEQKEYAESSSKKRVA